MNPWASVSALVAGLPPGPVLRRIVAGVVFLEGIALVVAGMAAVVTAIRTPSEVAATLILAATAMILGAGVMVLAGFVLRGDHRARMPVIVWQAMQIAAAFTPGIPGGWLMAGPLLVTAAVAGLGVMVPGVLAIDTRGNDVR